MTPLRWADLATARVGLWGLGTEGSANLAVLRSMGNEPVIVADTADHPVERVVATGDGGLDALAACEVVVKSPGISRHRPDVQSLIAAGVRVVGGLGLWLAGADPDAVVCITGTKGKSTTTAIAAHLARAQGLAVFAGGNLGVPPWDPGSGGADADVWFIETSSYQAADTEASPSVVAVTSLHPDHLPWHGDVATYYADKLSLCTRPGARLTIAAVTDELVAHRHQLGDRVTWVDRTTYDPAWAAPLGMVGDHNLVNAFVARACCAALGVPGADDDDAMAAAAAGFTGLAHRLEDVGVVDGVRFVDDGLSTNVLPTVAALEAFAGQRVALIAGGADRGIDYAALGQAVAGRADDTLVLAVYTTGPAIADAVRAAGASGAGQPRVQACTDLADAVRRGWQWARPDGVVLLSPAAASFDAFDDYRHRSAVFRAAVETLG